MKYKITLTNVTVLKSSHKANMKMPHFMSTHYTEINVYKHKIK